MWNGWLSLAWLISVHSSTVPSRGSNTGLFGKSAPLMTNNGGPNGCGMLLKITVRRWATGWVRKSSNGLFGGVSVVGAGTGVAGVPCTVTVANVAEGQVLKPSK